jgi:hypothetical protein
MPRNRTPKQWREILDAFDRTDLSQAEFCRRRGLALATFRYHRARASIRPVLPEAPCVVELFTEPSTSPVGELRLALELPFGPVSIHGQPAPLAELLHLFASAKATRRA